MNNTSTASTGVDTLPFGTAEGVRPGFRGIDLEVTLTGPWPAYNFLGDPA